MFEYTFYKNATPAVKESNEKVFGELEPVYKMKPNRFELPITSIRRILGDNFYRMEGTDDILHLIIFEKGGFNKDDLSINVSKLGENVQFLNSIFQSFVEVNSNQPFTKEFMEKPKCKLCITTPTGLQSFEICLKDLSPICTFDNAGVVNGMINMKEIVDVSEQINKAQRDIASVQKTGNAQAIEALQKTHSEYVERYKTLQLQVIEKWHEIIKGYIEDEDVKDVFDVSMIFSAQFTNPKSNETIKATSILSYHDGASDNVNKLKKLFNV